MADVFISYKSEEFDDANSVKTILETNGISCWMAPNSIPGGSSYAVAIPQAIRSAKVLVLVMSTKTQDSKWVPKELDQAINAGITIMPFMIENVPLNIVMLVLTVPVAIAAIRLAEKAMKKQAAKLK